MWVEWIGRRWPVRELPPTAAAAVARLADKDDTTRLAACLEVLNSAGVESEDIIPILISAETDADILELVGEVLKAGSARPWRTTVSLCRAAVSQWGMIRGRLIDKGIADPLAALPSLTALLDAVEVMILDSAKDDKERESLIRDLYRRDDLTAPPPGWSEGVEGFGDLNFS